MKLSIVQPAYLPWLGYIERIAISDIHVVLDHVQYEKRSFTARNRIRTPKGWSWLSVPVSTKGKQTDCPINELLISNRTDWRKDHLSSIEHNYKKSPYYLQHEQFFHSLYGTDWLLLNDLCTEIRSYLLEHLKIETKIIYSSSLGSTASKDKLILDICTRLECTSYISGPFGRSYLNENDFEAAGIKLFYHDYDHPVYPQRWPGFEPNMNIFDILFNCGESSMEILRTTDISSLV